MMQFDNPVCGTQIVFEQLDVNQNHIYCFALENANGLRCILPLCYDLEARRPHQEP